MKWVDAQFQHDGSVKIPDSWLYLHYYEAMNILFRYENSLRVLVYAILKNESFDEWTAKTFGEDQVSISSISKRRISQAQNFGYLGYEVSCPIMHLTSGELVELITSDAYWKIFKQYFRGTKEVIRTKFLEIGTVRNALAHFRPIKPEDIELLKLNTRHTLIGVETALNALFNCSNVFPTNSDEAWYRALKNIGSEYATTQIYQSLDGNWIRVNLRYSLSVLKIFHSSETMKGYNIANLKTPSIISLFPRLAKYVTSITENVNIPISQDGDIKNAVKNVSSTFHRTSLENNFEQVSKALIDIHQTLTEESELISQDELAQGELLEPKRLWVFLDQQSERKYWKADNKDFLIPVCPSDPPEYWGNLNMWSTDLISGADKFPWMQSTISKDEFPF